MTKIDLEINGKKESFSMPSDWHELSFFQYAKIIEANEKFHTIEDIIMGILYILLPKEYTYIIDLSKKELKKSVNDKCYYAGIIEDLVSLVYEFAASPKEMVNPNFDQLIIKDKIKGNSIFYGPDKDFSHLRINEYGLVENAIKSFVDSKDFDHLYQMVAILYRPKITSAQIEKLGDDYDGDPRAHYSDLDLPERVKFFKSKVTKYEVLAIKDWYTVAHKLNFEEGYPFVFKKKKESFFDIDAPQNDYAVAGMVLEMAGAKWGLVHQVYKQYCDNIFLDLNRINEKMEEENLNRILQ